MASARPMYFFMSIWANAQPPGLLIAATGLVCSAQNFSLSTEAAAKVISMNGPGFGAARCGPWALNIGDKVQIQQVIVTGADGFAKFQVSDGSFFEVYPNSNVIFRKNPGNWRDLLDVLVGRVKIHIQKWGGQPNPQSDSYAHGGDLGARHNLRCRAWKMTTKPRSCQWKKAPWMSGML